MLYDAQNNPIPPVEEPSATPEGRRLIQWENTDRSIPESTRSLTPSRLDELFRQANAGDPRAQARMALEIEEKDWDVSAHLQTRSLAVQGIPFSFQPPPGSEESAEARKVCDVLSKAIPTDLLAKAIEQMMTALLPGYDCQEILWGPGGASVIGFQPVEKALITFQSSQAPLLVSTNYPEGRPLLPRKFIWHVHRTRSGDPARGGLIRPLGWMFLFSSLGIKDLLRFVEKFGMPFVSARIDDNAWEKDRNKIAYLIRNFGSDGGAVFSKAVELEMLEGRTDSGDLYFRLLDYFGAAKTKVILGQTATSGDSGGLSKGMPQENVRKDLLQADCNAIAATVRSDLLRPICLFTFGPNAPVPVLQFQLDEPADLVSRSQVILNLRNAGHTAKRDWVEKTFCVELEETTSPQPVLALRAERTANRQAIAMAAQAADEKIVASTLEALTTSGDLDGLVTPITEALEEALAGLPESDPTPEQEEAFKARFAALLETIPSLSERLDTAALEQRLFEAMVGGDANGRLAEIEALSASKKR